MRHASESLGDPRRGYPRDERGVGRRVCPDRRETRRRVAVDDEKKSTNVYGHGVYFSRLHTYVVRGPKTRRR